MRGVPLLVALALLLISVAASAAGSATIDGPRLTRGDFWTYRTNTSVASGLFLEGRVTLSVSDRSTVTVEGTPFEVYNFSLSGRGIARGRIVNQFGSFNASGSWVLTGWDLADVRGLKRLWTVLDLEANGTVDTRPLPLPFVLRVQNTTRYRLEAGAWEFPLRVGDRAVVVSRMNFTEDFGFSLGGPATPRRTIGLAWWNVTYALDSPVRINTTAGPFDAFPINESYPDGTGTRLYFAPLAGNYARTEGHNRTSELGTMDLVAYRYQALEPPQFLGLTLDRWALVAVVVGAGATLLVWWWRRKKSRETNPSEGSPR